MKLQSEIVERWEGLSPRKAPGSYLPRNAPSAAAAVEEAEAGSKRARFLAADGQDPTPLEMEAMLGTNDLLDVNFLDRCSLVCRAVGRIEARPPAGRVRATGFLISPGLLITNHHVLPDVATAESGTVEFGYRYNVAGELGQTTRFELDPASFYVADRELDYAVVAVRAASLTGRGSVVDFGYLRMHPDRGKVREREFVTIIQHPEGQPLQIALRENQVTRLEQEHPFVQYEADTAHGSSGAPVFNDSLQLAALHSSGRIKRNAAGEFVLRAGGTTTSLKGLSETDVVWEANVGTRVSFICADLLRRAQEERPAFVPLLQQGMAGGDILARAVVAARTSTPGPGDPVGPQTNDPMEKNPMRPESENTEAGTSRAEAGADLGGRGLTIPLTLRVTLEDPRAGAQVSARPGAGARAGAGEAGFAAEALKMRVPVIYDGLEEREGFDPDFLELGDGAGPVEMPGLTEKGRKVAAPLLDGGGFVLRYHKFSVVMHKERRLAILTASNVDWRDARRKINGQKPSRSQLTGIPKGFAEQWVTDERIAAGHQLPDVFFSEDRQTFDKGHLVRRDDVCWGDDFEDMQMSNGDTYHVTNCSPQLKSFNQAPHGDFNWGDFEGEVEKKTKAEKVILFSGPVLDPKDRWFRGVDERGPVRVRTPSRFWKIVVSKGAGGPEAYGFIFEQDVTKVTEEEFAVSPEWAHASIRISEIAKLLRGWVDLSRLEAIDQFQAG
ncbi:MAG TPA: DNA/RNA non-specific endonuclease [Pyrinomonadaceae bacterium]